MSFSICQKIIKSVQEISISLIIKRGPTLRKEFHDDAFDAFINECVTLVGMHLYHGGSAIAKGIILCRRKVKSQVKNA